jgi:dTMP kinase
MEDSSRSTTRTDIHPQVFELDSTAVTSIASSPSQLSVATTSLSSVQPRDRVVSSFAPGQQQNHPYRQSPGPQGGPYRQSPVPQEGPYRLAASHTTLPGTAIAPTPKRGKLIVFEGLDRSGKSTQCALLVERLRERGDCVEHLRFPNRTTPIGQMINAYLAGESEVEDHVVHLLFSANRWEMAPQITRLIAEGVTVVVDRYYYSGCVYSAAKQITGLGLEWARHPDVGLPRPDLCVFLDVSPETASQRGGYGGELYERMDMQTRVRELFQVLLGHPDEENDVVVINADRDVADVERSIARWVRLVNERVDKQDLQLEVVRAW